MTPTDNSSLMDDFGVSASVDGQCLLIVRHGNVVAMISAMGSEPEYLRMDDGTPRAVADVLAWVERSEQADTSEEARDETEIKAT